jgi:FtsH-binding integral membrane protein
MDKAHVLGRPATINSSVEAQVYGLFALALALTALGVFLGMVFAPLLFSTGVIFAFVIAELIIIFTARWWVESSPLNIILFGAFPLISGITITPYLILVLTGYANGASILLNAFLSTAAMAGAGAVFVRMTTWNLSVLSRALFLSLLGLIAFSIVQIFVPSLRTTQIEMMISGISIVIFALFTVFDLQRIQTLSRTGVSPFFLALSLYLDIFNLFLSIVRFMVAISGNRR